MSTDGETCGNSPPQKSCVKSSKVAYPGQEVPAFRKLLKRCPGNHRLQCWREDVWSPKEARGSMQRAASLGNTRQMSPSTKEPN